MVGAFVGNECRGVAKPVWVPALNRYAVYLMVYSNSAGSETVTISMYQQSADKLYNSPNAFNFQINGTLGQFNDSPYYFYSNNPITDISLSNNTINENSAIGSTLGNLGVADTDQSTETITYKLTGTADNANFKIAGNALQSAVSFDFEARSAYTVTTLADDGNGNTFVKAFPITIKDVNEAPAITDQSFSIKEHLPNASVVGTVKSTDPDLNDLARYRIKQTTPNFATAPFAIDSITGQITVAYSLFVDYIQNPTITVQVEVHDKGFLTAKANITINLVKVETPSINVSNLFTPDGDGINDYFVIEQNYLYQDYELTVYNAAGQQVFKQVDYQNDWDGTYEGNKLPTGTYFYLLKKLDGSKSFKGVITLVRK
jgi:gliding motility-associated-like protein